MLVHTDQLTKRYGAFTALDTFSLDVPAGEIFGLLGPNGAGKTTLLRLLLGYITPTSGTASVLGFDSVRQSLEVKTRTAYLPGEARLFRRMNGHRVLDFFAALRPGCRREVAAGVARRLDLDCSRQVARMSTGMRQKLALAVVLAMETPLMILDEPTVGVDPQSRSHLLDCVRDQARNGVGVIYASHYMEEVQSICQRVAIVDHGRVLACDSISNLLKGLAADLILYVGDVERAAAAVAGLARVGTGSDGLPALILTSGDSSNSDAANERTDIGERLRTVLDRIHATGAKVLRVETQQTNLERLFLDLTGNRLRD